MKTTKTIEVNVCDVCHEEQHWLARCVKCLKEICGECTEHFTVQVTRSTPGRPGSHKSWHTASVGPKHAYRAQYCTLCAKGIAAALEGCGILLEKEDE